MNTTVTPEMINAAWKAFSDTVRASWDAGADARNKLLLCKGADDASAKLNRLQRLAAEQFAASRGYALAGRLFSLEQLYAGKRCRGTNAYPGRYPEIDHPQSFTRDKVPAALVTHSYAKWPAIQSWAAERGLNAERLEWSWWNPSGCIAVIFTPTEQYA